MEKSSQVLFGFFKHQFRFFRSDVFKKVCGAELLNNWLDDHILMALFLSATSHCLKNKPEYVGSIAVFFCTSSCLCSLMDFISYSRWNIMTSLEQTKQTSLMIAADWEKCNWLMFHIEHYYLFCLYLNSFWLLLHRDETAACTKLYRTTRGILENCCPLSLIAHVSDWFRIDSLPPH